MNNLKKMILNRLPIPFFCLSMVTFHGTMLINNRESRNTMKQSLNWRMNIGEMKECSRDSPKNSKIWWKSLLVWSMVTRFHTKRWLIWCWLMKMAIKCQSMKSLSIISLIFKKDITSTKEWSPWEICCQDFYKWLMIKWESKDSILTRLNIFNSRLSVHMVKV